MFCTKCGNRLSDTAKFCPVCGTPVEREEEALPNTQEVIEITAPEEMSEPAPEMVSGPAPVEVSGPAPVEVSGSAPVEVSDITPEPAESVPAPGEVQPAQNDVIYPQFGVPDVTIPATKWINGDEQLPLSETPQKKKKKGKLALIISLSSVAVLIGVAIGLAFLFSSKFTDKVEELEKYQNSVLVKDYRSEYDDLLCRAQETKGVIHVFGSFSVGSEIDTFLEKLEEEKAGLPEKALAGLRELENLGDTYYVDDWGSKIVDYGNEIRSSIDNADYEMLAAYLELCNALKTEIINANNNYKEQLGQVKNKIIDMRTSYASYNDYEFEADEYIEEVTEFMSSGNLRDVFYYLNKGNDLVFKIEEANYPYREAADRKEYYDELFKDVEVLDLDEYDHCLLNYSDALSGGSDAATIEEIVSEYADFYEQTHEANMELLQNYITKIENFDVSKLSADELTVFNNEYGSMKSSQEDDKLKGALEHARNCMAYVEQYSPKITDCEKFITMATRLASDYFMYCGYNYTGVFSEEQMHFICESVLTDELKQQLKDELGWGKLDEKEEEELKMIMDEYGYNPWSCGLNREECEELAYYITGNKHYFYKDIKDCSGGFVDYGNAGITKTGEIEVLENDDGTLNLDYDIQVFLDGLVYSARISITAVSNPDSFFDGYSVSAIDLTDAEEINYKEQYLKALELLYENEPDQYGEDSFSRHISMVYVNNDYIPELYVSSVFGYASAYLITYDTETRGYQIFSLESGDGFSEYITGEGVIRICDGRQGYYYDAVVSIGNDGKANTEFSGEYYYTNFETDDMEYKITYPETKDNVDASEYYECLDRYYTSKGPSTNLTGDYTYDFMMQVLGY